MKLLVATNNADKIKEFEHLLAGLPFEVTYPAHEGLELDPEETGLTFAENALIKARAFAQVSGLLTLADDSGLEVDALNKEPGIYSARYGNTAKHDHAGRCRLVLDKLAALNLPEAARTACFRCVIAIVSPQGRTELTEGVFEGMIAYQPAGENGFGYDPIFFVPEMGMTSAQLAPEVKNRISHRGKAARAAVSLLQTFIG